MVAGREIEADPILRDIINDIEDRDRASRGIVACSSRRDDFANSLEMRLAGIAMVPEARDIVTDELTTYWNRQSLTTPDFFNPNTEVLIGAGLHAAIYCASRVRMGYPKPVVLERGGGDKVGGAFAVSMKPVFRLNSRSRPGTVGLPNQDKALNYIPGALIQPSMISSEEYPDNADMAWLIRLALAQFAYVYPNVAVADVNAGENVRITTTEGIYSAKRVLDARGMGDQKYESSNPNVLNFTQLMERMGGMFPLRGMKQIAVIGGGDSAKCAVESLLGIAPGNTSAIGLDYVDRVDWYTGGGISATCGDFREGQRGRYIRIGQFLEGNISNPSQRLEVFGVVGNATPLVEGVIVNDRTYDMAIMCTGSNRDPIDSGYAYYPVLADLNNANGTELAKRADPLPIFRIGPAAQIPFSNAEENAGVATNRANLVAMFRLAQRTAGLAALLPNIL